MKKEYKPLNMVMNGRYAVLYGTLTPQEQEATLARMEDDDDSADRYHFECVECLYKYEFSKYGLLERFGPMFCHSDIINYGNLHNIDFIRTQTLCQGGEMCDFCFVRHRKGEVWERTRSV